MPNKMDKGRGMSAGARKGVLWRLIRTLFGFYPVMLPLTVVCILFNAVISSVPAVFLQNVIAAVEKSWQSGDWSSVSGEIMGLVALLAVFYGLSLIAGFVYNQLMAVITQGSLAKLRESPGAIFKPIKAASMAMVPEPQKGSANIRSGFQKLR